MTLKIIIAIYLIVLAIAAILPSSYFFRSVIKAPFLIPYLFIKIFLSLVSFGRFKMPQFQRATSERFRTIQAKSVKRKSNENIYQKEGWTSAEREE